MLMEQIFMPAVNGPENATQPQVYTQVALSGDEIVVCPYADCKKGFKASSFNRHYTPCHRKHEKLRLQQLAEQDTETDN